MNLYLQILNKYLIILLMLVYKLLLEILYIYFINPRYEYMGFILDINYSKLFFSWFIIILLCIYMPKLKNTPSNLIIFLIILLMIIPISGVYWLQNHSSYFFLACVISIMFTIFLLKIFPIIKFKKVFNSEKNIYVFSIMFSLIVFLVIFLFNGTPSLVALNFSSVYEVRSNFNYGYSFMTYLLTWQAWVLNPYLLIFFLKKRKYLFVILPILFQILIYLYTGHKAYLFLIIILPILTYFVKYRNLMIYILFGFIFGSLVSWFCTVVILNPWPMALFVHRLLYLPAQISYQYFEYFSNNGFVFLSHSIFESLFSNSVYEKHPILIIGEQYYNSNWPNTGYLADAFMNFGYIGMLVFSIIFSVILKIFDSFALNIGKESITAVSILFVFYFISGGLLTSLLNGGVIFFLLILLLSPKLD